MKKKSSSQIQKIIIGFVILLIIVLVGLIIFLLTVDIKSNRNYGTEQEATSNTTNSTSENQEEDNINISDYEIIKKSYYGDIEVRLSDKKVMFSVKDEELFKKNYPNSVKDTVTDAIIAVHENNIEDICIGRIGQKNYLFVLTDKGSIGVMNINEAVEKDVYRIKNKLISFEKPVVRMTALRGAFLTEGVETVMAVTEDGKKYDLSKFIE